MKPITGKMQQILAVRQANCQNYRKGVCNSNSGCECRKIAEVRAYVKAVIPDDYDRFTIDDFCGELEGKTLVAPEHVAAAKETIIKYCWEGVEAGDEYNPVEWLKKSKIQKRRENNNSIIIYGNDWVKDSRSRPVKMHRRSLGRTMLAAVVMKEAIWQRAFSGHEADRYAWVDFTLLCNRLMAQASGDHSYDDDIADYQDVDWLCVDKIQISKATDAGKNFRISVLDKLFGERWDNGLPNILVFQDDISQQEDLVSDFGSAINTIISSRKTFRVSLVADTEVK